MSTRRGHLRLRFLAGAGVAALCAAMATSAVAFVDIYVNNFKSKPEYREIEAVTGGNKCHREFKKKREVMLILVDEGPKLCKFKPPVQGSNPKPDHRFDAHSRLLKATPGAVRDDAYLMVAVRVGGGKRYELRVFPKDKDFQLRRQPGGAGFPVDGGNGDIGGVGEVNKLRVVVIGDRIRALVNGTEVADVTDANPGQVSGTKLEFGVGTTRNTKKDTQGTFDRLKVSVPNP